MIDKSWFSIRGAHERSYSARHLEPDHEFVASAAGSLGYAAPEVLLGKEHGKPVDLWSIGYCNFLDINALDLKFLSHG